MSRKYPDHWLLESEASRPCDGCGLRRNTYAHVGGIDNVGPGRYLCLPCYDTPPTNVPSIQVSVPLAQGVTNTDLKAFAGLPLRCYRCGRKAPDVDVRVNGDGYSVCLGCFTAPTTEREYYGGESPALTALRKQAAAQHLSRGDMEAERARLAQARDLLLGQECEIEAKIDAIIESIEDLDALIVEAGGKSCFEEDE